jgi:hypothetical protein
MQRASLKRVSKRKKEEAISYISSYQTLTAEKKIEKLLSSHEAQKISGSIYGTIAVNLLTTNTTIHNITTMVVPFATHTAWDLWIRPIGRA